METRPAVGIPDFLVVDTCVLISNVLRRLVLGLASSACFEPAWSGVIGDEWKRNAARLWGVPPEDIEAQWDDLQLAFPHADQGDIHAFKLGLHRSDPKDWHVIAVARAILHERPIESVGILTRNIRDFNRSELRSHGIVLFDPDVFLVKCWSQFPERLQALFELLATDALAADRPVEALETVLKRERLFRLNRLCMGQEARHVDVDGGPLGVSPKPGNRL